MEYINSDISLHGNPVIHENLSENIHEYNTIGPMNYTPVLPSMDNTTDNFYYLVGRKDRFIKINGLRVNLSEVEDIILKNSRNEVFYAV